MRDISDQNRRSILESLFFHDILNAAGGIHGLAGILADTNRSLPPEREEELRQGMARLSQRLIEEINHQRDLLAAERGVVRISCRDLGERVALGVNNPGVMSRDVQLQVFQRSFSTKADWGRGIGTYSIKLFVECYLKGTVGFTSAEPGGTTFSVILPKEPAAD